MKYWGSQPQSKSSQHSRALNADVLTKVMLESLKGSEKKSFFPPLKILRLKAFGPQELSLIPVSTHTYTDIE